MLTKSCDACHEYKQLTHRVRSDILDMTVCYECGIRAELSQSDKPGGIGNMTISIFERPKVIPMFFECSVCHESYTGEQQYAAHWYEKHG